MRFTDANVKAYKDETGRPSYSLWDENLPGFGFRVQAGGSKVYYVKYRVGAKQRMLKIGRVDKLALADAVKKAKAAHSAVADAIDPANTRATAATAAGITFNPAYDGFLAKLEAERSETYYKANKGYMANHFAKLHGLALASIEQDTVSRILKTINDERGPIAMNRARSAGSAFFNWAWREGLCKHNPFEMTNKNEEDEDGRDRTLLPKELKVIWRKAPSDSYGDIVRLLMLTLCRRTEIGALKRTEINWKEKQIELPGKVKVDGKWVRRTKNGRPHVIPLSAPAFDILEKRCADRGMIGHNGGDPIDDDSFVFGRYDNPFSGWSKAKDDLDKIANVPAWVLHDLRRTGDTGLAGLGLPPHIVDAVMNHVSTATSAKKGVRKKYNKHDYIDEKRDALDKYAAHLMAIVA
jgi:integrase